MSTTTLENHDALKESRAQRIAWLLEELGLEHEIVSRTSGLESRTAPPELSPVLTLEKIPGRGVGADENDGQRMVQSIGGHCE